MSVVVQKYGGSSVADIDKLRAVADQVVRAKEHGNDVVVVVSAMGKTTDNLLSLAQKAADGAAEPPKRELDMLVSTGERVSMALLSIAIQARGHDAVSFTGSQSGIITNDRHFDARIIDRARCSRSRRVKQAVEPFAYEAPAPLRDGLLSHVQPLGNRVVLDALGAGQHDAGTQRSSLGTLAPPRQRLQLGALALAQLQRRLRSRHPRTSSCTTGYTLRFAASQIVQRTSQS